MAELVKTKSWVGLAPWSTPATHTDDQLLVVSSSPNPIVILIVGIPNFFLVVEMKLG